MDLLLGQVHTYMYILLACQFESPTSYSRLHAHLHEEHVHVEHWGAALIKVQCHIHVLWNLLVSAGSHMRFSDELHVHTEWRKLEVTCLIVEWNYPRFWEHYIHVLCACIYTYEVWYGINLVIFLRFGDVSPNIRVECVKYSKYFLVYHPNLVEDTAGEDVGRGRGGGRARGRGGGTSWFTIVILWE